MMALTLSRYCTTFGDQYLVNRIIFASYCFRLFFYTFRLFHPVIKGVGKGAAGAATAAPIIVKKKLIIKT